MHAPTGQNNPTARVVIPRRGFGGRQLSGTEGPGTGGVASRARRLPVVPVVLALGACWRLWLMGRYAGWEESDYGNLAMVRGVLEGGFRHYDMSHMPGYYALSALVMLVVGDAVVAAKSTSLVGGLVALGLATALTERVAGRGVAWIAGVLMAIQPEFSLYAASSLREPVYAAFVLASLAALSRERLWLAGLAAGAAFSVRFESALGTGLVLALHAAGQAPRGRRLLQALSPLVAAGALWSIYCHFEFGTFVFWGHAVQVNLDTGLGGEAAGRAAWALDGLRVVFGLATGLLPSRVGWGPWLGLFAALAWTPWAVHGLRRSFAATGFALLGLWLAVGFVAQHAPDHNLYWKWLCPIVPLLVPLGVGGLLGAAERASRRVGRLAWGLAGLLLLAAPPTYLRETARQVALSDRLYRPQRALAEWFEAEVPEDVPLLLDNIPACYLNRRPNERLMVSWFDVPSTPGDPASFSAWLRGAHIGWVLWFREDWTQASAVAPFLAQGGLWRGEGVTLTERRREDDYGWILFEVSPSDAP